ncbi:MAG TPA: protein kinase [Candidatus Acidoferrum sp.]|nr:protein kinase [Candidatus Acidoferrum sp.]
MLETLGMGGMGVVVSAYDVTLDRKIAIKVLRPDRLALDPQVGATRLLREAQAMARLSHPNVITVHEVGTLGDQVFVAMEQVDGETLAGWLGRRTWREVVALATVLAQHSPGRQAGRGQAMVTVSIAHSSVPSGRAWRS